MKKTWWLKITEAFIKSSLLQVQRKEKMNVSFSYVKLLVIYRSTQQQRHGLRIPQEKTAVIKFTLASLGKVQMNVSASSTAPCFTGKSPVMPEVHPNSSAFKKGCSVTSDTQQNTPHNNSRTAQQPRTMLFGFSTKITAESRVRRAYLLKVRKETAKPKETKRKPKMQKRNHEMYSHFTVKAVVMTVQEDLNATE